MFLRLPAFRIPAYGRLVFYAGALGSAVFSNAEAAPRWRAIPQPPTSDAAVVVTDGSTVLRLQPEGDSLCISDPRPPGLATDSELRDTLYQENATSACDGSWQLSGQANPAEMARWIRDCAASSCPGYVQVGDRRSPFSGKLDTGAAADVAEQGAQIAGALTYPTGCVTRVEGSVSRNGFLELREVGYVNRRSGCTLDEFFLRWDDVEKRWRGFVAAPNAEGSNGRRGVVLGGPGGLGGVVGPTGVPPSSARQGRQPATTTRPSAPLSLGSRPSDAEACGTCGACAGVGMMTSLGGLAVLLALGVIVVISHWRVFAKAGEPGWAAFIPLYNFMVLGRVGGEPDWFGLLMLIPVVNLFIYMVLMMKLAARFGRTALFGIGLLFLPMIFYPILAFGSASARPLTTRGLGHPESHSA